MLHAIGSLAANKRRWNGMVRLLHNGKRSHDAHVQTKAERRENDAVQACHWITSLTKRWLLGTHAGAVAPKHLQAYLDEYALRHNRRRTKGVGRIAARLIESLMIKAPLTMRAIIDQAMPFRRFQSPVTHAYLLRTGAIAA
jgi:hypothetical protein